MTATLENHTSANSEVADAHADLAMLYLGDLLQHAILAAGAPLKVSEAARACSHPEIDLRLARVVLVTLSNRFTSTDRKWMVTTRLLDPQRPVERMIDDLLVRSGRPVSAEIIAAEVGAMLGRAPEIMLPIVERLLANGERFAKIGDLGFVRRCVLLDVQSANAEDILFDNFLTESDIEPYESAALDSGLIAFLDSVGHPVPSKVLQFLIWRRDPAHFHAETVIADLWANGAVCLSTGEWIGPSVVASLSEQFAAISDRQVSEESAISAADAQPLVINEEEREQLVGFVLRSDTTSFVPQMLEDIFEVSSGEPTFEADRNSILECLRTDPRVVWIGGDRFLPTGAIPDYVFTVPTNLEYVDGQYFDLEGNAVDVLLDDDGLSGGLKNEIMSQLAQDVGDEEPIVLPEGEAPVTVRCVLRFHHKEIGTFPLCQLPPGYFPSEAPIVQVEIALPNGHTAQAWVNHETRLVYGLLDWYDTVPIDSGAVFYIERRAPDQYVLTFGEETEPSMFVSRNRLNDLLELRKQAEAEQMPTFDILRTIMEHYRKGIEFITVLTEVGIVRRTRRRNIASLLSAYHCFFQRNKAWVYDARKLSQGLDRSKRKYLIDR